MYHNIEGKERTKTDGTGAEVDLFWENWDSM